MNLNGDLVADSQMYLLMTRNKLWGNFHV